MFAFIWWYHWKKRDRKHSRREWRAADVPSRTQTGDSYSAPCISSGTWLFCEHRGQHVQASCKMYSKVQLRLQHSQYYYYSIYCRFKERGDFHWPTEPDCCWDCFKDEFGPADEIVSRVVTEGHRGLITFPQDSAWAAVSCETHAHSHIYPVIHTHWYTLTHGTLWQLNRKHAGGFVLTNRCIRMVRRTAQMEYNLQFKYMKQSLSVLASSCKIQLMY